MAASVEASRGDASLDMVATPFDDVRGWGCSPDRGCRPPTVTTAPNACRHDAPIMTRPRIFASFRMRTRHKGEATSNSAATLRGRSYRLKIPACGLRRREVPQERWEVRLTK